MIKIINERRSSNSSNGFNNAKEILGYVFADKTVDKINSDDRIPPMFKRGLETESDIDKLIVSLSRLIVKYSDNLEQDTKYDDIAEKEFEKLGKALSMSHNVDFDTDNLTLYVNDISERKEMIDLADEVQHITDAKYNGTGRGGSWTAWNMITSNGTHLRVGVLDNKKIGVQIKDYT